MRLPEFTYLEPNSLTEAVAMVQNANLPQLLAGGTDLLVAMKNRVKKPETLVNLKQLPELREVGVDGNSFVLGSLLTMQQIASSSEIQEHFSALAEAAGRVASWEIRQAATLGGNIALDSRCWNYNRSSWWRSSRLPCYKLGGDICYVIKKGKECYATASADTVPALIALGAEAVIYNGVERRVPVEELFSGKGENPHVLEQNDIIVKVIVPLKEQVNSAFVKIANREVLDFPLVNCAAAIYPDKGVCLDVKLVVSGVSMNPVKIDVTADLLNKELNKDWIAEMTERAVKQVKPISNSTCLDITASYRRQLIRKAVTEALERAWQRAKGVVE